MSQLVSDDAGDADDCSPRIHGQTLFYVREMNRVNFHMLC